MVLLMFSHSLSGVEGEAVVIRNSIA